MRNLRRKHICENIDVLKRILDVIKYQRTQALPYRSHRGESIYASEDRTINHGNFLELVLFLARTTPLCICTSGTQSRLQKREKSLENRGKEKSRGRGNLTAMLSKSTTNKILSAINIIMKKRIVEEIGERTFSVQMDSSMDTLVTGSDLPVCHCAVAHGPLLGHQMVLDNCCLISVFVNTQRCLKQTIRQYETKIKATGWE